MFAYCNNNPAVFVDYVGAACTDALRRGGDGLIIGGAGSGGGVGTILLLDLLINARERITNRNKNSTKSNKSSSNTAGGATSPKPPKKGKGSPNYAGDSLYNKNGVRIDYEYYGNGNGNVHLHKNGSKYYYDSTNQVFRTTASISSTLAPSTIQQLLYDPKIQKALTRGVEIIQSLGGY